MSAMKTLEGVEWAAHACALLASVPPGASLSAAALADFHELPTAYMAKHLQRLVRGGVLVANRGARGGYQLARPAGDISLWDVQAAIEGSEPSFKCQDIRRRGPCAGYSTAAACDIACAFIAAEASYRNHLKAVSIADMARRAGASFGPEGRRRFSQWVMERGAAPIGASPKP
jgi:Rrf2 family protein